MWKDESSDAVTEVAVWCYLGWNCCGSDGGELLPTRLLGRAAISATDGASASTVLSYVWPASASALRTLTVARALHSFHRCWWPIGGAIDEYFGYLVLLRPL